MRDWLYKLWKNIVNGLTFGGDINTYSAAILSTAGQSDAGQAIVIGPSVYVFSQAQTAQSITNSTTTTLTNWGTVSTAPAGAFNASSGVFTCPLSGMYMASLSISYQANTNWALSAVGGIIQKNGTEVVSVFARLNLGSNSQSVQTTPAVWVGYLNQGDTLTPATFQNSGATQTTEGTHTPFVVARIGP